MKETIQNRLQKGTSAVVMVSHDRAFLNAV